MARNYCFTINQEPRTWPGPAGRDKVKYLIAQLEKGEESEHEHWQGYVELKKTARFKEVKKILGAEAHLESRKGTRNQARDYCRKEDTKVEDVKRIEIGNFKNGGQGKRTDLDKIARKIKHGARLTDIARKYPSYWVQFNRGFISLKEWTQDPSPWRDVKVFVIWGKPGSGKTRIAKLMAAARGDYYILGENSRGDVWFDGYREQKTLIIDDFYGWIKWGEILRILDGHEYRCQIKGSSCWAQWSLVIITSNKPWQRWYPGIQNNEALKRRIHIVKELN